MDKSKRRRLFNLFDPNGNGYLSLAEIDKGFNDMGEKMRAVYLAKKPMLRAFVAAKDHFKSKNKLSNDYV